MASQQWDSGLCGCFSDCGICCKGFWCPCFLYGDNIEKAGLGENTPNCVIYFIVCWFTGCQCLLGWFTREKLRKKYGLPAAPCNDFCVHCCCHGCALCQETRQVKAMGLTAQPQVVVQAPYQQKM